MNTLLEATATELPQILPGTEETQSAAIESQLAASLELLTTQEPQISQAEQQRWVWLFEQLKNADIGLSFVEKVKAFCEAATPEEVEDMIYAKIEERTIIPLAA